MGLTVRYEPPPIDARPVLAAAAGLGVEAAGKLLLDASLPLVPVESGDLKASGRAEMDGPHKVRVSYDAVSVDGYEYGIRQHEDGALHHPNGGQDHFLSTPARTEADAILAALAAAARVVL